MDTFAQSEMDMVQAKHQCKRTASAEYLEVLLHGDIVVEGLLPYSSNYTLLTWVEHQEHSVLAVYKPCRGERPLWDFPQGTLYRREIAAYLVSEALGFGFVPLTVMRDGPLGIGAIQLFVRHDPEAHLLTMLQEQKYEHDMLCLAAFDFVINNADRKSGHALKGEDECLWAIDHGICFHHEHKLRTVLWNFVGRPFPSDILQAFSRLKAQLDQKGELLQHLQDLLDTTEIRALKQRLERMIKLGTFPPPGSGMHIPWPPV
jgi:hypothetical protein